MKCNSVSLFLIDLELKYKHFARGPWFDLRLMERG